VAVAGLPHARLDHRRCADRPHPCGPSPGSSPSRFLDGTSFVSLAEHYDPAELPSAGVYPGIWDQDWALSYLEDCCRGLVALFHAAATEREPILTWMD